MTEHRCDRRGFLRKLAGRGAVAAAGAAGASALLADAAGAGHDGTNTFHLGETNTSASATTTLSGSQFSAVNGNGSRSITASHATASAIAVEATANTGAGMRIAPDGGAIPMSPETGTWLAGSMRVDEFGDIWYCWLGGTGVNSGWYPLSLIPAFITTSPPQRIYHSNNPAGPKILNNQQRVINVPVPNAFAALINIAVFQTTGTSGYLAVFAADETWGGHSNVNWFGTNQILACSAVTQLDPNGDFRVRCGTNGSTHFVVDLMGVYVLTV